MGIIEEYKSVVEQIAILNSQLVTTERELNKQIHIYKPSEVGAISYDNTIRASSHKPNMIEVADAIYNFQLKVQLLRAELESWIKQRSDLERVINELGDSEKKALMLKLKGLPVRKIARQLNFSERHVRRILEKADQKCPS